MRYCFVSPAASDSPPPVTCQSCESQSIYWLSQFVFLIDCNPHLAPVEVYRRPDGKQPNRK